MSACPICKGEAKAYPDNRFAPFCCERCRLVDLGNWVDGSYRIPDEHASGLEHEDAPRADGRDT